MVMGDGYAGLLGYPGTEYTSTVSKWSGTGRIRAHTSSSSSLGSGTGWATGYHWLSTGGVHYYHFPNNPQAGNIIGAKAVVNWFDADYQGVGDLKVQIVDLCPSGGGEVSLVTASPSQTMRKRVQIRGSSAIAGRCIYLRIEALNANSEMYYYSMYT